MRPRRAVLSAAVLATLGLAAPALASGAPWNRVTTPDGSSVDQVSVLRNTDGVMVAWQHPSSPTTTDLLVSKINGGKVESTSTVVAGWAGIQNPAIVPEGTAGLRVFWGGQQTTNSDDPLQELNTAASADGGSTWALQPTSVVEAGNQAYGAPVTAAAGDAAGLAVSLQAWAGTLGLFTHRGLTTAIPTVAHPVGNYAYNPGLAYGRDGFGFAWYSNAAGSLGVFGQIIDPNGNAVTPAVQLPGTANMTTGMLARTPIVGTDDQGAGFYVAYPTGNPTQDKIRVFGGIGTKSVKSTLVGRADGNSYATLAITPDGRLWVAWTSKDDDGDPVVIARRSNPERTEWGEPVVAGAPRNAGSAYAVDAVAAEDGDLNLFANMSIGTAATTATWVTHVEPGLTLTRTSGSLEKGDESAVKFKVTDAGDPVKGVKVTCGSDSGTTNKKGVVKLDVTGRGTQMTAKAKNGDYTTDTLSLRVRK